MILLFVHLFALVETSKLFCTIGAYSYGAPNEYFEAFVLSIEVIEAALVLVLLARFAPMMAYLLEREPIVCRLDVFDRLEVRRLTLFRLHVLEGTNMRVHFVLGLVYLPVLAPLQRRL
jgi:hypothetical protein